MSDDMGTEEVANGVDKIISESPNKEGTPHTIKDCRTIRLTSHPSKVMQASEQDGIQLNRPSTAES